MISKRQLSQTLEAVDLKTGDTVFVHSDLNRFGIVKDEIGKFTLALNQETLFDSILSIIGSKGTIVVPTFTYGSTKGGFFDPETSKSATGVFSEYVRTQKSSLRSRHPMLSIAAVGKNSGFIIGNKVGPGFGPGSPYEKLHDLNTKFLMVGVPYCSYKDHVEAVIGVSYRYKKYFSGQISNKGKISSVIYEHDVRYLDDRCDVKAFLEALTSQERKKICQVKVGDSTIRCATVDTVVQLVTEKIKDDEFAFIEGRTGNENIVKFIKNMLRKQWDDCFLDVFAVNGENGEEWVWQIMNASKLDQNIKSVLETRAIPNTMKWWSEKISAGCDYIIQTGGEKVSGAEAAISIARDILQNHNRVNYRQQVIMFLGGLLKKSVTIQKIG